MSGDTRLMALVMAIELFLLVITFRKSGLLPVPTGALLYIIFYQVAFYLVHRGDIESILLMSYSLGGTESRFQFAILSYFVIFLFLFAFGYKLRIPKGAGSGSGFTRFVTQYVARTNSLFRIFLLIYMAVFAIGVNWSVAWSNDTYLTMTDPDKALAIQAAPFRLALSLLLPVGLACASLSALNFGIGRYKYGLLFASGWLASWIYFTGSHQRASVLIPAVFAMTYALLTERPVKLLVVGAALIAIVSYPFAIAGRQLPEQGIASIGSTISMMSELDTDTFVGLGVTNLAEGIFIFAESSLLPAKFPDNYKILSLSPFPSAIDGFAKIQDAAQVRLTETVPMSGYVEALNFGPPFVVVLALYFVVALALNRKVATQNRLAFLLINLFIFLGFFVLGAYPLRNGQRFLLVAIGFSCIILYSNRRRMNDQGNAAEPLDEA